MGSEGMFKGAISILEQGLDLRSMKHNLLVSNIANKTHPTISLSTLRLMKKCRS